MAEELSFNNKFSFEITMAERFSFSPLTHLSSNPSSNSKSNGDRKKKNRFEPNSFTIQVVEAELGLVAASIGGAADLG
jgi:hypothetical protein